MDKKPKALVILTPGFPEDEADTNCLPERQAFVRALKASNPKLEILVLAFQYPFFKEQYSWYDVQVKSFGGKNRSGFHRLQTWMQVWRFLIRLRKKKTIIGLFSFWLGECALVAKLFTGLHRFPHFCWLLGQDARKGNRYARWFRKNEASFIVISDFLAHALWQNHRLKAAHVIPPGYAPVTTPIYSSREIDIIGVGSLIPLKRFDIFIDLVKQLKTVNSKIAVVLCGDGPQRAALQKKIDDADLRDTIEMLGDVPNDEVLSLMRRSKILLHPSSYEGFGYVFLEALYSGVKVVSFCKPMNQNTPNFYACGDVDEMYEVLHYLLNDRQAVYSSHVPFPMSETIAQTMELLSLERADHI